MTDTFVLEEALEQAGNDENLLRELVGIFLEEGANDLALARVALTNGDARTLEAAVHRVKGAAGYFGAHRLCRALADLEDLARRGSTAAGASELARAESEWRLLVIDLDAWRRPPNARA